MNMFIFKVKPCGLPGGKLASNCANLGRTDDNEDGRMDAMPASLPGDPVTFKDLVRLLRRRWLTAIIVFVAVFTGFMGFSAMTERPQYRARARILISTPPVLL